jgi:protein-disulfide isomerase
MNTRSPRIIYIAAVLAVLIVGGSLWYTLRGSKADTPDTSATPSAGQLAQVRGVQANDHIRGNPNAPIVFIEYSDFACPFCKDYHKALGLLIDTYGKDGKIAWVFRHMPLVQLHPQAPIYALASECAAQVGGEGAFWKFADAMFATMTPQVTLDSAGLLSIAESAGVDRQAFAGCMRGTDLMPRIETDFTEAKNAGAVGTPFTVVVTDRSRTSIAGARPYAAIAAASETILRTLDATDLQAPATSDLNSMSFDPESFNLDSPPPGQATSSIVTP